MIVLMGHSVLCTLAHREGEGPLWLGSTQTVLNSVLQSRLQAALVQNALLCVGSVDHLLCMKKTVLHVVPGFSAGLEFSARLCGHILACHGKSMKCLS